jgi:hypothetical protein
MPSFILFDVNSRIHCLTSTCTFELNLRSVELLTVNMMLVSSRISD